MLHQSYSKIMWSTMQDQNCFMNTRGVQLSKASIKTDHQPGSIDLTTMPNPILALPGPATHMQAEHAS